MNSVKIVFFHPLNDFSGSPNVLSSVIKGLAGKGFTIDLYTSSSDGGHLSDLSGINYHKIYYRFSQNKILTLIRFLFLQLRYFLISINYRNQHNIIFYLNTILPFGAAMGARFVKSKVIYHIHELPVRKNLIHKIALLVFKKFSDKAIFVSEYLFENYKIEPEKKILALNSLLPAFISVARQHEPDFSEPHTILMVSSLKKYKGIDIFYNLAMRLNKFEFVLVLNSTDYEIMKYFTGRKIPKNLKLSSGTKNLHPFYQNANLVVNLSISDLCIESFGLTILEALTYGIPVIVPPYGGIAELVEDGKNGYKADSRDQTELINKISAIFEDKERYSHLSFNSRRIADRYSYNGMIEKIEEVITHL